MYTSRKSISKLANRPEKQYEKKALPFFKLNFTSKMMYRFTDVMTEFYSILKIKFCFRAFRFRPT